MEEVTLKDLYRLRVTLKNRMAVLNKIKTKGHYKNSTHSRGVESFTDKFLDPFTAEYGFNRRWNHNIQVEEENNHIVWGVKGQMQKLVVELRLLLKNDGNKLLTYNILCKIVTEYYPEYKQICERRKKRLNNKPYDDTKRIYSGHVKLRRLLLLEKKQGFNEYNNEYFSPSVSTDTPPVIKINLP